MWPLSTQTINQTVSVVICTRDRVSDLIGCLESIKNQTVQPDQVVIVSGSVGSCPDDIQQQFPTLLIDVSHCFENNISISRNMGVANSSMDLMLFIDDDATAEPTWVESYKTFFIDSPNTWVAGGPVFDLRRQPLTHEFHWGQISRYGLQKSVLSSSCLDRYAGFKLAVKGCNFAANRKYLMKVGGFDPFFKFAYDESDLVFRVYAHNGIVQYCQDAVVNHAHTPGHYRNEGPLDRNWFVEYASHTMFMLKNTMGMKRLIGYLIVGRRLMKFIVIAALSVVKIQSTPVKAIRVVAEAIQGIRYARTTYYASS